jgi:hypothetical protein
VDIFRKRVFWVLAFPVLCLLGAEFLLRVVFHVYPGQQHYSPWFTPVDSLEIFTGYEVDGEGILKVNPKIGLVLDSFIENMGNPLNFKSKLVNPQKLVPELEKLVEEYQDFRKEELHNTLGWRYFKGLNSANPTSFEFLVIDYVGEPINSEGFRSIPLKSLTDKRLKVMLLGSDLTWGKGTVNITNSFADELLGRGLLVYNLGICGADGAQYLALAKKYVPILKPDVVVLTIDSRTDIRYFDREIEPYTPLNFYSNAGMLSNRPAHAILGDPSKAYRYAQQECFIPPTTWFNKACAATALTTLAWIQLKGKGMVQSHSMEFSSYLEGSKRFKRNSPAINETIKDLEVMLLQQNVRLIVSFLPEVKNGMFLSKPKDYPQLDLGRNKAIFKRIGLSDYNPKNGLLNNKGHKRYADFLNSLISK